MKKSIVLNTLRETFINCSAKKKYLLQNAYQEISKLPDEVDDKVYQDLLATIAQPEE